MKNNLLFRNAVRVGLPFLLATLGWCYTGCAPDKSAAPVVTVRLNDVVPLEELNKILVIDSVIPIRTGDSCGITHPNKAIYRGQNLYLNHWQSIYKYNIKEGSFQQIINQVGHASNEYTHIDDYNLDDEQQIYLLNSSEGKVLVFDNEGKYLRTIRKVTGGNSLAILPDKGFAIAASHLNRESLVTAYSPDGQTLYATPPTEFTINFNTMTKGNILAHGVDEYIFSTQFDNNIYCTKNAQPSILVTFDYGDKNSDLEEAASAVDFSKGMVNLDKLYKKVSFTDYFCLYKQYLTFRAGQYVIIYDTEQQTAIAPSQIPYPYNLLFHEPLAVSPEGNFCIAIGPYDVKQILESDASKNVSYFTHTAAEYEDNDVSLVLGHFKVRDKE